MGISYLLITCEPHKNIEVANIIRKLSGVKESLAVVGAYDCIVKTEEMDSNDVQTLVLSSIRPLDNIRSILTLHDTPVLFTS